MDGTTFVDGLVFAVIGGLMVVTGWRKGGVLLPIAGFLLLVLAGAVWGGLVVIER